MDYVMIGLLVGVILIGIEIIRWQRKAQATMDKYFPIGFSKIGSFHNEFRKAMSEPSEILPAIAALRDELLQERGVKRTPGGDMAAIPGALVRLESKIDKFINPPVNIPTVWVDSPMRPKGKTTRGEAWVRTPDDKLSLKRKKARKP